MVILKHPPYVRQVSKYSISHSIRAACSFMLKPCHDIFCVSKTGKESFFCSLTSIVGEGRLVWQPIWNLNLGKFISLGNAPTEKNENYFDQFLYDHHQGSGIQGLMSCHKEHHGKMYKEYTGWNVEVYYMINHQQM